MQIMIEISDTLKQIADDEDIKTFSHGIWQEILMNAIKNGTPLPKGHGRIGDLDEILLWMINKGIIDNLKCGEVSPVFEKVTIIEADKEKK